jgi:hypothetical protein
MRSPEDLPADIMDAAEKALDTMLCHCRESCGSTGAVRAASIYDIARALMERDRAATERAAKIADERPDPFLAAAIRSGGFPTESIFRDQP